MANEIIIKNGTTTPGVNDGDEGELLYDKTADKLYISKSDGDAPTEIGNTTYLPLAGGTVSGNTTIGEDAYNTTPNPTKLAVFGRFYCDIGDGYPFTVYDGAAGENLFEVDGGDCVKIDPEGVLGSTEFGGGIDMNNNTISDARQLSFNATGASPNVNAVYDEDDMSSDSNQGIATQQSIKAYVDNKYQWVQFSSCKYSMTTASAWYLGTKEITTAATVLYSHVLPSAFEQDSLPVFQNCGTADVKVHRFRYFFVYDGSTSSDDLKLEIFTMKGDGGTGDNEFDGATALASVGGLSSVHSITLTNLNDDMWHHRTDQFTGTIDGTVTLEPGEIMLPLIESSASTRKSIYLNCAYLVSGMGGDY